MTARTALCARRACRCCSPLAATSDERALQGWVEAEIVFVSPDEQGRVETLKVREGDKVAQGRPVVHAR